MKIVKKNKTLTAAAAALLFSALLHAGIIGAASGVFSFLKGKPAGTNEPINVSLELMPYVSRTGHETELAKNDAIKKAETAENNGTGGGAAFTGGDDSAKNSIYAYHDAVKQRIQANRYYPQQARQNGIGGKSMVAFSINRDGTVKDVRLFASSGNDILDREAVENIMRASPFPKLPDTVKEETLALEIAISFKLN